jgi:hypothetical protein
MKSLRGRIGSDEALMAAFSSAPPSQKYKLLIIRQARKWSWAGKGIVVMLGWDWSLETRVERARRMGGGGFTMESSERMPMRRVRWEVRGLRRSWVC